MQTQFPTTAIIGTGAMGRGIAQMAAQAGSRVKLFDNQSGASERARTDLFAQWDRLLEKGRIDDARNRAYKARLECVDTLGSIAD
ncbi:MAG: 3-hydroxyacyl-CoA dehydrogenase NAD-binding domain-containing protein, partial [Burkholderiaceae bacterium]